MLTAEYVRELLDYDPETGVFRWKVAKSRKIKVGAETGCLDAYGYKLIGINGRVYRASRLAWVYMTGFWPEHDIDHINGNPDDDRWCNLRAATRSQNQCNRRRQCNNTSGYKGVNRHSPSNRWEARATYRGKTKRFGLFDTPEEAYAAYCANVHRVHGDFSRTE